MSLREIRKCSAEPLSFAAQGFHFRRSSTTLEGGQTLAEFLDDFPTVSREAAISALEQGKLLLVSQLTK